VIPVVCRKVDMLSEVEGRKKRQELRTKVISRIVKVDIEVDGYYKFMRTDRIALRRQTVFLLQNMAVFVVSCCFALIIVSSRLTLVKFSAFHH